VYLRNFEWGLSSKPGGTGGLLLPVEPGPLDPLGGATEVPFSGTPSLDVLEPWCDDLRAIGSGITPSLTKCIFDKWCLYAPFEMKGVSQKAHFIIESDVITASLHAQLKARIAPGVVPAFDGILFVLALTLEFDVEECVRLFVWVSVLSHSFCKAANG
jgi:hypothetical protein